MQMFTQFSSFLFFASYNRKKIDSLRYDILWYVNISVNKLSTEK